MSCRLWRHIYDWYDTPRWTAFDRFAAFFLYGWLTGCIVGFGLFYWVRY